MRFRLLFALFLLAVPVAIQPAAAQVAYEPFLVTFPDYDSGAGLSGAWEQGGSNAFAANYTAQEASLAFRGLRTTGGRISGGAFPAINGAIRNFTLPFGTNNTTVYLSFLIRPLGTLNAGVFNGFFGVTLAGGPANELFVGKPGGGAVEEYVIEHRGGFGQIPSGVATVVGQTALLVVRADYRAGNDTFTLYPNPTPGSPEPMDGVVKTDLDLGAVTRIGIYSTGAFALDEIRVGTTFESVTPRVTFAGTSGAPNCHGKSVSALSQQHGGMANAATALGYASVAALQNAITNFCEN